MLTRGAVVLLSILCLLSVMPPGASQPAEVSAAVELHPSPRGPIHIDGEADLTPENGVRGGSGTPDDPYVINDWVIVRADFVGVRIENTQSHILVKNVVMAPDVVPGRAFQLINVSHVTLENVRVSHATIGMELIDADHILVDESLIAAPNPPRSSFSGPQVVGFDILNGENITIRNTTVSNYFRPFLLFDPQNLTMEYSTFSLPVKESAGEVFGSMGLKNATIQQNVFENVMILIDSGESVTFAENVHTGARRGIWFEDQPEVLGDITVCGSTFEDLEAGGLFSSGTTEMNIHVSNNRFIRNNVGVNIHGNAVLVSENLFQNSTDIAYSVGFTAPLFNLHNNSFENNANGAGVSVGPSHDLRWNWWGHPSGPSGPTGNGSGEAMFASGSDVEFWPPLTAPPELDFDCVPGEGAGDQSAHPILVGLDASTSVDVNEKLGPAHIKANAAAEARLSSGPVPFPV